MSAPLTRRAFGIAAATLAGAASTSWLLGKLRSGEIRLLRPPGAGSEALFLASCIRCGQCVEACPPGALKLATMDEGFSLGTPYSIPEIVPCDLCGGHETLECIRVCPSGALSPVETHQDIDMGEAALDTEICFAWNGVTCRSCWHACPFPNKAIVFDELARATIDEEYCIGCGLCIPACLTAPKSLTIRPKGAARAPTGATGD